MMALAKRLKWSGSFSLGKSRTTVQVLTPVQNHGILVSERKGEKMTLTIADLSWKEVRSIRQGVQELTEGEYRAIIDFMDDLILEAKEIRAWANYQAVELMWKAHNKKREGQLEATYDLTDEIPGGR